MITAQLQGRRLTLAVETGPDEESIAPFLVEPVSARVGRELSIRYLLSIEGLGDAAELGADVITAFGQANAERADDTLTQREAETMLWAAYFWQTVGGLEAARAILEVDEHGEQGGVDARGKALAVFRLRSAPLLSRTRQSLESARRTQRADTRATATRPGGAKLERESSASRESDPPTTPNAQDPAPATPSPSDSPPSSVTD